MTPEEAALQVALRPVAQDLDPTVRQWLRSAFADYLAGKLPLERALGLSERSTGARDGFIRSAGACLPGSRWRRAQALSALYRATRMGGVPEPPLRPAALHLRMAERHGRLPRSAQSYWRILGRNL